MSEFNCLKCGASIGLLPCCPYCGGKETEMDGHNDDFWEQFEKLEPKHESEHGDDEWKKAKKNFWSE
jgi:hypothetical protein